MNKDCILAIDQGTTSSRAIVFDQDTTIISIAQQEFPQIYPHDGWVEHAPDVIWQVTLAVSQQAFKDAEEKGYKVVAIGITNQRETTLVWDKSTGKVIYNAIVWQDRRTADICRMLKTEGLESEIQKRTGLLLDPYFSATKIAWILDNVTAARVKAEQGQLAFGTIDSYLIWQLTGGVVHATDATNASRTNLYNIHTGKWDDDLLKIFHVPAGILPKVLDCSADFGMTVADLFGRKIPISGVAGDQQAAGIGQCCFTAGSIKITYGTGCFALINTGKQAIHSKNRLLTTIAYQLDNIPAYAIEGSIFVAGAALQWLRDDLKIIANAAESETMASRLDGNHGVYVVPALTGLGAPYWESEAKGSILGLTRATGTAEIVRATLESVCYLTADLFSALAEDGIVPTTVRVDGGMVNNNWLLQFLANILALRVLRPIVMETTALGAAYLTGRRHGVYGDFDAFTAKWHLDREFSVAMDDADREALLLAWHRAVRSCVAFQSDSNK